MEFLVILLGGVVGFTLFRLRRLEKGYEIIYKELQNRGLVKKVEKK